MSVELSTHGSTFSSRSHVARAGALRALFVLNSLRVGGSETKTVRLVNALRSRGILAGIVSLNEGGELGAAIEPGIPVWHLHRRGKFSMSAVRELRRLIRARQPDVVASVNLYPALYASLATLKLSSRPRTVAMLNTTVFARQDAWRPSFYRPFLRRFDAIVYGCEVQRTAWGSRLRSMGERSSVIYNGIDTAYFAPSDDREQAALQRQSFGIPSHAFVVGSVARLTPAKNQSVLIDAVAALRNRSIDAHLLLVGHGPLRSELEGYAEERKVRAHVTFAGAQRDVRPALAAMDVFVLPSSHVETFSNAALEAMAMRKPVILSRIGGADEMVRDGTDGFVLDVDALSNVLPELLAHLQADPEWRERLGEAARARVIENFSIEVMVRRYASLIAPDAPLDLPLNEEA